MKTIYAFYAANRYWPDRERLMGAFQALTSRLQCPGSAFLITDTDSGELPPADTIVIIPMSGAVQKRILTAAALYPTAILYGAYISGNVPEDLSQDMMRANAAPTLMDTWAVLHRTNPRVALALKEDDLAEKLRLMAAYCHVHGATVLKIGETEPWVVSTAWRCSGFRRRKSRSMAPRRALTNRSSCSWVSIMSHPVPKNHWLHCNEKGETGQDTKRSNPCPRSGSSSTAFGIIPLPHP